MGYSLALGYLPLFMLEGRLCQVLGGLLAASYMREKEEKMAEARRDAIKALARSANYSLMAVWLLRILSSFVSHLATLRNSCMAELTILLLPIRLIWQHSEAPVWLN